MRVLFTFAGGTGHFLPLVPLARAAEEAGHAVAFAGQQGMLEVVERAGFSCFDTGGPTLLMSGGERTPLLELDWERELSAVRDGFAGRTARERSAKVLELCKSWRPHVLVCDEMDFGALVAAESAGVPYASVVCIGSGSFVWPELVAEPLKDLRAGHGLAPDPELAMLSRYLILSPFPPSFRDPANPLPPTGHAIRPVPADAGADDVPPRWLAELDPPLVYFTLGTIFNLESGDLFERVLAGLSELPVSIVVTVGREVEPETLGPQPANVRVEQYVPQSLLLPDCDLVVSHAGSGSVVGALAHGLPMVLLPIGADQPLNAARCAALDVARVIDPFQATSADVASAAEDLLADVPYRRNAQRVQEEIAALPGPEYALHLLEQLTRRSPEHA